MSALAPSLDPATPNKSALWMLGNIWFEPGRVFEQVARTPRWWLPLLLIVAAVIIYMFLFSSHVGWESFIRHELDTNPRTESMPREQREQVIALQLKILPIMGVAGPAISIIGGAAFIAAVLMLVFKYLLDGPCGFAQALGVVSWSMLPGIVNTAAAVLVMMLKPPDEFDLKNPVGVNVGYFLGEGSPPWMKSLMSSIDFFSFWTILLLATGMAVITRKSWGSSLVAVLIPWGIYVVCKTGWAAIFG